MGDSRRTTWSSGAALLAAGVVAGCGDNIQGEVDQPDEGEVRHINMTSGWFVLGDMFGGGAMDEANDVLIGPDGNVYVAGFRDGQFGQSSVEPSGNASGVIIKYTAGLHRLGSMQFGASNSSAEVIEALAVAPGASGPFFDLYFAGRSNGAYAGPNGGQFDTIVGWVQTANGNAEKFQYGNEKPQHPKRLFVNDANELIVTGFDDIYIPSNYVDSWEDPYVLKLRRNGNTLETQAGWPYQPGSPNSDVLNGMTAATTADAPIYVNGTTFTGPGRGMFVRKLGTGGTVEWHQQISMVGLDSAAAMATLPNGDLLFAGATWQVLGQTGKGEQDIVLRLMTPARETRWTVQHGTSSSELLTDMAVDGDGNIYVVGETLGSFDPEMEPPGDNVDIFVLKLAPDGALLDSFQLSSPGDDHPSAIAVDRDGRHVYVVGYSTTDLLGKGDHDGGRDGFVLRLTPPSLPSAE